MCPVCLIPWNLMILKFMGDSRFSHAKPLQVPSLSSLSMFLHYLCLWWMFSKRSLPPTNICWILVSRFCEVAMYRCIYIIVWFSRGVIVYHLVFILYQDLYDTVLPWLNPVTRHEMMTIHALVLPAGWGGGGGLGLGVGGGGGGLEFLFCPLHR